jgi:DNA-binding GntR family transcriptional regulator
MAGTTQARTELTGVDRCAAEIRSMVLSGELLPGEHLKQGDLAKRLNVSRIPIREALAKLHTEGILAHKPNTGFTVARFSSEDLAEIYLMRRLLETELLRTCDAAKIDLEGLRSLHEQMSVIKSGDDAELYQRLNREFHFALFDTSPLELVREEVSRLWYMSGFYRTLYLLEPETFSRLQKDHEKIIRAVKAKNNARLIELMDQHRSGTEQIVVQRLGRPRRHVG